MIKNRSLSFKLVLLFLLTGVAMMLVLRFASGGAFVKQFQEVLRPHLFQYFQYINHEIGTPPNLETAKRLSDSLKIKIIIRGPDLRWSSDGIFPQKPHIRFKPNPDKRYQSGRYKRQFVVRIPKPPFQTTFITQNSSKLPSPWRLVFNTILGILLVLGLLYFLLRRMISPLKDIQKSVKRIGSGELDHRITIKRQDELGDLSHEINGMADDIENMLEAKRQLLLAISHELRSPITRAKVAVSLMDENSKNLQTELENDLNEMETMVSGLLEAEQLNHRHQTLNLTQVDINSLISGVISTHFTNDTIQVKLNNKISNQPLDEARIQFVIKNLLGNALKYRKQQSDKITISSNQNDKALLVIVEDHGIGIPEKHIPHLSEPFYRVDPSRHRETGGYGLGLYIIKMIIEAHRGELLIESKEGHGTKVSIKIPNSTHN